MFGAKFQANGTHGERQLSAVSFVWVSSRMSPGFPFLLFPCSLHSRAVWRNQGSDRKQLCDHQTWPRAARPVGGFSLLCIHTCCLHSSSPALSALLPHSPLSPAPPPSQSQTALAWLTFFWPFLRPLPVIRLCKRCPGLRNLAMLAVDVETWSLVWLYEVME